MSKKRRTPEGRANVNPNPTPENTADQQEVKGGLKEKAKAVGSKVAGTAKSIGGKIWDNDECPDEIEQPEPDEETPDTEAADE